MKKRILQFSILALLLIVACAIPLKVADAASGSISANSQFVYISSGLGSTTISWSTSGCTTAKVYVNMDNTQDIDMSTGTSGSANLGWIVAGHSYVFKLYAETDRTVLLDSITVVGYGTNSGNLAAFETEAIAPEAGGNASIELTWGTNGYTTAQIYVSINGGADSSWIDQGATGTNTPTWVVPGYKYDFKLYANTNHTTLLDTVTVYGRRQEYTVGVNYHATGSSFDNTSFLRDYHVTAVRNTVLSQLQGMANAGVEVINTHIWMVETSGTPTAKWKWNFPPSTQQLTNLNSFAEDVADIQATDGHRLKLDITILGLWAASWEYGTPTTTLGYENLTAAQFLANYTSAYQGIVDAVYNVYRPDSQKVADTIYLWGEVMVGARDNEEWFLENVYPGFATYCLNKSVKPSTYFSICGSQTEVLDNTFTDGTYPVLNYHRSMFWAYRSIKFFNDNSLYLPGRTDFSIYPIPTTSTQDIMVTRIFDDMDATMPSLGCRKWYSVVETYYFADNDDREELGAAYANERLRANRLSHVGFWTTPDAGGLGVHVGYPFDVADYLP